MIGHHERLSLEVAMPVLSESWSNLDSKRLSRVGGV